MKKFKFLIILLLTFAFGIIFLDSFIDIYLKRNLIIGKITSYLSNDTKDKMKPVNALTTKKQPPPFPYNKLKITENFADNYTKTGHGTSFKRKCEDDIGAWTAPFDWSVESLHAALLPDGTVLTFGSYSIAPPSEPMGTRDMDSTPPATTKSSHPERTFMAAIFTVSTPDAQKRLI